MVKSMPFTMADIINLESYSLLQETNFKKITGAVMIMIFKKGQGISENTSQLDKLYQILQGQVEIRIDGATLQLTLGQAIIIPANTFVQIKATNHCKIIQTIVESEYVQASHLN